MKYQSQHKTFSFVDSQINPIHNGQCQSKCCSDKIPPVMKPKIFTRFMVKSKRKDIK